MQKGTLLKVVGLCLVLVMAVPQVGALAQEGGAGSIITAGSSTVGPLSERMAERFREDGYAGNITVDIIGSGAGFERFCTAGETDISNASRPIKAQELANCRAIGREPVEIRVGTDALSVVVSATNDFVTDVTSDEMKLLFSTAVNWSDVRPDWPAQPIMRYIPGTDSGTFDYFVEHFFNKDKAPILAATNTQLSEDDNVLVQGVQASPYAIGFFGYAYYQENQDTLKVLSIDGIAPTYETVEAVGEGAYPLARPLFLYTTAEIMAQKPQVAAFINYYLTHVNEEIESVGYFPASLKALNASKATFLSALGIEVTLPEVDPLNVTGG